MPSKGSSEHSRPRGRDERIKQLSGPLGEVLARLPDMERRVVEQRMGLADGHPNNLAETARSLGLSMSEAREIEQRAFSRIREVVPLERLQKYLQR